MASAADGGRQTCNERGRVLWRVGDFLLASLRGQNATKYLQALEMFQRELRGRGRELTEMTEEEVDYALADHLIDLHEAYNDASRLGHAGLLVAAVGKVLPRLRLKVSWKVLDAWRVRVPPRQAPTFPPELAFAIVTWFITADEPECACAVLLCYTALLRVSEALHLRWQDCYAGPREWAFVLGQTKSGMEQKVVVRHPRVLAWLREYRRRHGGAKDDLLCPVSYARFARQLQVAATALGFGAVRWTSHGLRRGAATQLLREGVPLKDVMLAGRWLSERSCREYLRRGEVCLTRLRADITPAAWARATRLASAGELAWTQIP